MHNGTVLASERRDLFFLLGLALGLRILLYQLTYLISIDGTAIYLPIAKRFASGQWMEGLAVGYHPIYPLFVALFSKVLGDLQLSGQVVSILFGTLTVVPLYYLAREAFGGLTAFFSSLFLAILPRHVALSADVLSDPTYTFFFILAIWLGWEALKAEDWKRFILAGVAIGLAYLDRAEGIGVLLLLSIWIFLRKKSFDKWNLWRRGGTFAILFLSFLLVALPYILYLRSYTGTWTLSRKPSVHKVVVQIKEKLFFQKQEDKVVKKFESFIQQLQQRENGTSSGLVRWLKRTKTFFKFFITTFHPLFFLFFIGGLTRRRVDPPWTGEGFLYSSLLLYALILYWLTGSSYISRRYFIPFVALCFVWSGRGLIEVHQWLCEKISERRWKKLTFLESKGLLCLTLVTVLAVLPVTIESQREEKIGRREAGFWIKNNSISKPLIYTDMPRVNYYAGGKLILLKEEVISYEELVSRGEKERADFLVVSDNTVERLCPNFFKSRRPEDLEEVFRTRGSRETVIVYRFQKKTPLPPFSSKGRGQG